MKQICSPRRVNCPGLVFVDVDVASVLRSKGMSKGAANSVKRVAVSMLLPDIFV